MSRVLAFGIWNLNKNLRIDDFIHGYGYDNPTANKRDEKFYIAFSTYTNKKWYLIGFSLNTEFIPDQG